MQNLLSVIVNDHHHFVNDDDTRLTQDHTRQAQQLHTQIHRCRYTQTVKGSPYPIAELRVPELIPVLGSQLAGDVTVYCILTVYFCVCTYMYRVLSLWCNNK